MRIAKHVVMKQLNMFAQLRLSVEASSRVVKIDVLQFVQLRVLYCSHDV
jgi:hypothetical protein